MTSAIKTPKVSLRWRKILRLLPDYDCFAHAAGYWFDEEAADHVVQFFETRLHHIEGQMAGNLLILEDWQKAILGAIFGWKDSKGLRRYRKVLLYIPRKNGKTTLMAGIGLYMLACEEEAGQQIFGAAAGKDQAALSLNMAKKMVAMDDELSEMIKVWADSLTCDGHSYKLVSTGFRAMHGLNVSLALIDEVHEHPNRTLTDTITTSSAARDQPLFFFATTAADYGENFCNELYDEFCAVRDGLVVAPTLLPVIYEVPQGADWKNERNWKKANPNLGISVKLERLREAFDEIKRVPSKETTFRRLHLNQRTQSLQRWIAVEDWDECAGLEPSETPQEWRAKMMEKLKGCDCWGGIDLGSVSDLTAFVLLFDGDQIGEFGKLFLLPWFWCPEVSILEKSDENRDIYNGWAMDGFMLTTPGRSTDFATVRADIVAAVRNFNLIDAGMDTFQGGETCTYLREFEGLNILGFGQGFNHMANPTQEFEILVKSGRIIHGGNPILRWMVSNCMVKEWRGLRRPIKESGNSSKKIDGLIAALMALGRYQVREAVVNKNPEVMWI